ncbi:MAG TPA: hypothetical protein GXX29_12405 [Firmicutes bacterium]|nr:hypothetical protein [Bacillota bacterium]
MAAVKVKVFTGNCGFDAEITMRSGDDGDKVELAGVSSCSKVQGLLQKLTGVSAMELALTLLPQNPAVAAAGECRLHAACPVPTALIKAAEICAGAR